MINNSYLLKADLKREKDIPLISRESIIKLAKAHERGDVRDLNEAETNVYDLLTKIEVKRLASLYKSFIFDFSIEDSTVSYTFADIEESIRDNIGVKNKRLLEYSTNLMSDIIRFAVTPVDNIFDFHKNDDGNLEVERDQILERFIEVLEQQTYENVWSDLMKYPFDNQTHGLRKHLMLGIAASTGKSIILEAMGKLYEASASFKSNRPENGFDAANWNADIIDKFVVLLDDDNPNISINEDYLKNFLSNNMPQQLARGGGQRWSEIYYGSSVIALNTAPDFLKNQQNNKRVIFLKLTQSIEEMFTSEELNHLHNLEPKHILGYVNSEQTKLFKWRNDWSGVIEDLKEDVKQHISMRGYASLNDLKKTFGDKVMRDYQKQVEKAKNITINGEAFYGFKDKDAIIDEPYRVNQLTFSAFINLHDVIGERNFESLEDFKNDIEEYGKLKKEEQPLFSPAVYHDELTKANLTGFVGVVLDIDGANAADMDELEDKIAMTGLSAIAWETASSTPSSLRARIWFYRVGGGLEEYASLVKKIAMKIDEPFDRASMPAEHRFFIGGTNVRLINIDSVEDENKPMTDMKKHGLVRAVQNAKDGEREQITYWALMRAEQENGGQEFMRELIEMSGMREVNKQRLTKQFKL